MKKFILVFLLILSLEGFSQKERENVLLIINPTTENIRMINRLVENKLITIPVLKVIGIYNTMQDYDFDLTKEFIKKQKLNYITLEGFDFKMPIDSLFCKNSGTKIFYELFKESEGVIFTGGPDIPPKIYGEKTNILTQPMLSGRLYEISFMFHLIGDSQNKDFTPFLEENKDYRIFGICLGMQIMNVAAGGSLIQDIPSVIYNMTSFEQISSQAIEFQHTNYESKICFDKDICEFSLHPVEIEKGNLFDKFAVTKDENKFRVVSMHHQCVKRPGKQIHITAKSLDGKVVEAVEHEKYKNVFGVQFHPEISMIYDNDYKYKRKKGDKIHTISEDFKNSDIEFHKELWHYFSSLFDK